jgi:hypothetical protein
MRGEMKPSQRIRAAFQNSYDRIPSLKMTAMNSNPRCQGQTKSGNPCRAAATAGGLCFFHANPRKAAELGRIGGRKKSRPPSEAPDPLPRLDKVSAVRDAVEKLIADVYAGKLHPRVAAGLAPLLNLQLRAVGVTDLEQRLEKVEKLLARTESDVLNRGRNSSGA